MKTNMYSAQKQRSEISRLLAQIKSEYEAAQRGLFGLASGTSQHVFVTQKMENMGRYQEALQELVGEMPAVAMIARELSMDETTEQPATDLSLLPCGASSTPTRSEREEQDAKSPLAEGI